MSRTTIFGCTKNRKRFFDWLAIIAISIALYLMLGHLNVFAGGIASFGYCGPLCQRHCDRLCAGLYVRPVQRYVMKENPKLRWLSILMPILLRR